LEEMDVLPNYEYWVKGYGKKKSRISKSVGYSSPPFVGSNEQIRKT
jgi:hypothetical protein